MEEKEYNTGIYFQGGDRKVRSKRRPSSWVTLAHPSYPYSSGHKGRRGMIIKCSSCIVAILLLLLSLCRSMKMKQKVERKKCS